jgi:tetratricopeptide (TPR) repeat protein
MRPIFASALFALTASVAIGAQHGVPTDKDRRDSQTHYQQGQAALHNEKYDEAEREFQTSIKLDPSFELARYGLGQTFMAVKRYKDAITAFIACRDVVHANNATDATDETARQRRIDDTITALEDQKRLYQQPGRSGGSPMAKSFLQQIDIQLSTLKEERHRPASAETATPAWLSLALGSAYFRIDDLANAEQEYRNAITVNPKLGEAHNNLAVVYLTTGRAKDAAAELDAAEKAGYKVNPQLKEDVHAALKK